MTVATDLPDIWFDQLDQPLARRLDERADEPAARASLRRQISRLESQLAALTVDQWIAGHRQAPVHPPPRAAGSPAARLLGLAELEQLRDELVQRIHLTRRELAHRSGSQALASRRLGAMLDDPGAHRYEIVPLAELGQPACGAYHVLPRLGLLGMLFGWWCVKLSSGCP